MANTPPNLGFDPNQGRRALDVGLKRLTDRLQEVSRSRPFVAFVGLAVIVFGLYYFVIAAPIYVSNASFSLRGRDQAPAAAQGALLAAVGGGASTEAAEAAEVSEFILSYDMLAKLDQRFQLRQRYTSPRADLFYWLPPNAKKEDFLKFYRRMVKVRIDRDTNIIRVEARTFDAGTAQQMADAILTLSADYVDGLSATVRHDTLKASEQELQKAENAVRDSRLEMTKYRTTTGLLDPVITAAASSANITQLEQQVQEARNQIASLMTYSTANNPVVVQLRARVTSLQAQMVDAQNHLTTNARPDTLAQRLYQYEGLKVTNEYAEKQLVAALASYDSARALAGQRERFLVRITSPHRPDKATLPNRTLSFFEALLVAVAAYGIIALVIAGVRDHQGI